MLKVKTRAKQTSKMRSGMWSEVFPLNTEIEEGSRNFVKKLVTIGISSVAYLRGLFGDDDGYKSFEVDGLKLTLLDDKSEDPRVLRLCRWIDAALKGLDQKYIKKLTFAFYNDVEKPEDAFETYSFFFSYREGGDCELSMEFGDQQQPAKKRRVCYENTLYAQTKRMLRKMLTIVQKLEDFTTNNFIGLHATFTDETPEDYKLPGFDDVDYDFKLEEEENNSTELLAPFEVSTKCHSLRTRIKVMAPREDMEDMSVSESSTKTQTPNVVEEPSSESILPPTVQTEQTEVGQQLAKTKKKKRLQALAKGIEFNL